MSNSLDPNQARHSVVPDLGPNCLQRFSAEDESSSVRIICLVYSLMSQSTALVMSRWSVYLTTLLPFMSIGLPAKSDSEAG